MNFEKIKTLKLVIFALLCCPTVTVQSKQLLHIGTPKYSIHLAYTYRQDRKKWKKRIVMESEQMSEKSIFSRCADSRYVESAVDPL